MSRRLVFLAGSCSGLIVGAVVVLLFVTNQSDKMQPNAMPTMQPVVIPEHESAIPDNWVQRDFSGQPYYVVPLGSE